VTKWVAETRSSSLPAILTGFGPDDTPGIGTYYDFSDRITDGRASMSSGRASFSEYSSAMIVTGESQRHAGGVRSRVRHAGGTGTGPPPGYREVLSVRQRLCPHVFRKCVRGFCQSCGQRRSGAISDSPCFPRSSASHPPPHRQI